MMRFSPLYQSAWLVGVTQIVLNVWLSIGHDWSLWMCTRLLRRGSKYCSVWPLWLEISSRYSNFHTMKITWDISSIFYYRNSTVQGPMLPSSLLAQSLSAAKACALLLAQRVNPSSLAGMHAAFLCAEGWLLPWRDWNLSLLCLHSRFHSIKCLMGACEIGGLPLYSSTKCIITVSKTILGRP